MADKRTEVKPEGKTVAIVNAHGEARSIDASHIHLWVGKGWELSDPSKEEGAK